MPTKAPKKAAPAPEAVQVDAKAPVAAAKTQGVTFLRSHPAYSYWPGDKAEIDAKKAAELIAGGFAE